jgi:hypothetical protein
LIHACGLVPPCWPASTDLQVTLAIGTELVVVAALVHAAQRQSDPPAPQVAEKLLFEEQPRPKEKTDDDIPHS